MKKLLPVISVLLFIVNQQLYSNLNERPAIIPKCIAYEEIQQQRNADVLKQKLKKLKNDLAALRLTKLPQGFDLNLLAEILSPHEINELIEFATRHKTEEIEKYLLNKLNKS